MRRNVFMTIGLVFFLTVSKVSGEPSSRWFHKPGDLFSNLIADPEEAHTSLQIFRLNGLDTIDINLADSWGIRRWMRGRERDWLVQLDISGAVQPRFLGSTNFDEMEALDFFLNVPLEVRHDHYSARFTFYHESAHLGDEFIERTGQKRISYSREGVQSLVAADFSYLLRIYGGMTNLIHVTNNLPKNELQGGFEARTPDITSFLDYECSFYLAQDFQSKEENRWNINSNSQIGFTLGFKKRKRILRFFLNYFKGHSNFGQFHKAREEILGMGLTFEFLPTLYTT